MFIILIKASLVLVILLAFYKLILEKESFFSANRFYLLGCLGLAFVLPYVILPKIVQHQGYFDSLLTSSTLTIEDTPTIQIALPIDNQDSHAENKIESKASNVPLKSENKNAADQGIDKNIMQEQQLPVKSNSRGILFWMFWIYIFGVIILTLNLLAQVLSILRKVSKNQDQIEDEGAVIVNLTEETEPCSFFKYIFINPSSYDFDTYEQIIAHEKIHVAKKHTLDLLLSEIAVIILWFNPFVWIFRKEVEKNIEYQTDQLLISNENDTREEYQMNLVKIACNTSPLAITTNYNQSLIKQRILKMNAKRSNNFNYWKYTFGMPLLFVLLLVLNKPLDTLANSLDIPEDLNLVSTSKEDMHYETESDSTNIEIGSPTKKEEFPNHNKKSTVHPTKMKVEAAIEKNIESQNRNRLRSINSMSEMIANCEEFEKAVASGDLEKVKEILQTLDPGCLKIKNNKKSNFNSVKELIRKNKSIDTDLKRSSQDESQSLTLEKSEVCSKLKEAVNRFDHNKTRWILLEEDLSCLNDAYGDPIRDQKLLKGLLSYGAHLDIDIDKVIHIDDIGFTISIPHEGDSCNDPNYLKLTEAIKEGDQSGVIRLLSNANFTCPLNQGGVKNDFPFIKELMKYQPEVLLINKEAVTVYGVGMKIDLELDLNRKLNRSKKSMNIQKDSPSSDNEVKLIKDIEKLLASSGIEKHGELTCLTLMDAIIIDDYELSKDIISEFDPNCFHRHTHTETSNGSEVKVSDETVTPLIIATMRSNHNIMKLLIENEADVNFTGDGDITPLMIAVMTGNLDAVKILVNNKAKLNTTYTDNMTALDIALRDRKKSITKYLKSKGAKANIF